MTQDELESITIDDLIRRHPSTARVFVTHKMRCAGCLLAPFMTVNEAAGEYGLDPALLSHELMFCIASDEMEQSR